MSEIIITDPVIDHIKDPALLYNEEFVVTTITCLEIDDIIFSGRYNVYVNGEKVEDE